MRLLKKYATDLGIKFSFKPKIKLTDKSVCTFLELECPANVKGLPSRLNTVFGTGPDEESARQEAATDAVKFIRKMCLDEAKVSPNNNISSFNL